MLPNHAAGLSLRRLSAKSPLFRNLGGKKGFTFKGLEFIQHKAEMLLQNFNGTRRLVSLRVKSGLVAISAFFLKIRQLFIFDNSCILGPQGQK